VTIKAYVDRIEVVSGAGVVARHERSCARGEWIVQPQHYLAILGRRPATLDHSFVFDRWELPACFEQLWSDFEQREGLAAGARQYVRVLQLLAEYPVKLVQEAIIQCRKKTTVNADHILATVRRLGDRLLPAGADIRADMTQSDSLQVPIPKLDHFDLLLSHRQGDLYDDGQRRLLAVHLKRLRLPTMLAEYEKLAQGAAQEKAQYLQYLLRLGTRWATASGRRWPVLTRIDPARPSTGGSVQVRQRILADQ
jgi:hypothetical protein